MAMFQVLQNGRLVPVHFTTVVVNGQLIAWSLSPGPNFQELEPSYFFSPKMVDKHKYRPTLLKIHTFLRISLTLMNIKNNARLLNNITKVTMVNTQY